MAYHFAGLLERPIEVCVFLIQFVHDKNRGVAVLRRVLPDDLGPHLGAFDSLEKDDRRVRDTERRFHLACEVGVPGGIQDVDLVAFPFAEEEGGVDGDLTFDLIGVVIGEGITLFYPAEARRAPGGEEGRFSGRRLPRTSVADQGQVPDVVGREFFHVGCGSSK